MHIQNRWQISFWHPKSFSRNQSLTNQTSQNVFSQSLHHKPQVRNRFLSFVIDLRATVTHTSIYEKRLDTYKIDLENSFRRTKSVLLISLTVSTSTKRALTDYVSDDGAMQAMFTPLDLKSQSEVGIWDLQHRFDGAYDTSKTGFISHWYLQIRFYDVIVHLQNRWQISFWHRKSFYRNQSLTNQTSQNVFSQSLHHKPQVRNRFLSFVIDLRATVTHTSIYEKRLDTYKIDLENSFRRTKSVLLISLTVSTSTKRALTDYVSDDGAMQAMFTPLDLKSQSEVGIWELQHRFDGAYDTSKTGFISHWYLQNRFYDVIVHLQNRWQISFWHPKSFSRNQSLTNQTSQNVFSQSLHHKPQVRNRFLSFVIDLRATVTHTSIYEKRLDTYKIDLENSFRRTKSVLLICLTVSTSTKRALTDYVSDDGAMQAMFTPLDLKSQSEVGIWELQHRFDGAYDTSKTGFISHWYLQNRFYDVIVHIQNRWQISFWHPKSFSRNQSLTNQTSQNVFSQSVHHKPQVRNRFLSFVIDLRKTVTHTSIYEKRLDTYKIDLENSFRRTKSVLLVSVTFSTSTKRALTDYVSDEGTLQAMFTPVDLKSQSVVGIWDLQHRFDGAYDTSKTGFISHWYLQNRFYEVIVHLQNRWQISFWHPKSFSRNQSLTNQTSQNVFSQSLHHKPQVRNRFLSFVIDLRATVTHTSIYEKRLDTYKIDLENSFRRTKSVWLISLTVSTSTKRALTDYVSDDGAMQAMFTPLDLKSQSEVGIWELQHRFDGAYDTSKTGFISHWYLQNRFYDVIVHIQNRWQISFWHRKSFSRNQFLTNQTSQNVFSQSLHHKPQVRNRFLSFVIDLRATVTHTSIDEKRLDTYKIDLENSFRRTKSVLLVSLTFSTSTKRALTDYVSDEGTLQAMFTPVDLKSQSVVRIWELQHRFDGAYDTSKTGFISPWYLQNRFYKVIVHLQNRWQISFWHPKSFSRNQSLTNQTSQNVFSQSLHHKPQVRNRFLSFVIDLRATVTHTSIYEKRLDTYKIDLENSFRRTKSVLLISLTVSTSTKRALTDYVSDDGAMQAMFIPLDLTSQS